MGSEYNVEFYILPVSHSACISQRFIFLNTANEQNLVLLNTSISHLLSTQSHGTPVLMGQEG